MSRPQTPSSLENCDATVAPLRPLPPQRTNSREKTSGYKLFPTVAVNPTPPTSPQSLQKLSLSRTGGTPRTRAISFDNSARIASGQQDVVVKTVPVKRGRKISNSELRQKHMSTIGEIPSPTVSIPYSFLPRNSEDTGHARSNSAPGEFVRDSQTLPSARIDLSKSQWISKQADSHPAKGLGLGLSMPASISVDRLDKRRQPPNAKPKPNLTIEIKNDARLKPKAIVVRDEDFDDGQPPPPPPPKSPRHDSRNQSLSNITYDPRKVRRTHSKTASRSSSTRSHSSPDSPHPSEEARIAPQGNFVKAALVNTPSPSSSPAFPKPTVQHSKQDSYSPLSGDVRIRELMTTSESEAQDDLDRPIPPPITPGQPRVASMARVISIPSLPKSVAVEKSGTKQEPLQDRAKPTIAQNESKSTETIVPIKRAEEKVRKAEKPMMASDPGTSKAKPVKQGSHFESTPTVSPAVSSTSSKMLGSKASKINLDKPMPSLPLPSSRFSEHMRQVRAAEGGEDEDAPPVPAIQGSQAQDEAGQEAESVGQPRRRSEKPAGVSQPPPKEDIVEAKEPGTSNPGAANKQKAGAGSPPERKPVETAMRGPESTAKVSDLSAFPSVPEPPRYYARGAREESPSGQMPSSQHAPRRDVRQQDQGRDSSLPRRFPPGHPLNRSAYPPFMPGSRNAPKESGPPRSRFYGRQSESANNSVTSLVEQTAQSGTRELEATRSNVASPEPNGRTQSPAHLARSPFAQVQAPTTQERGTPILEAKAGEETLKLTRLRNGSDAKQATWNTKAAPLGPIEQAQSRDLLKRPESPANIGRAPSPTPSLRPSHPGDLLDRSSAAKSLPGLPPESGPRPPTPDAASVLPETMIPDPVQTLRDLTKQSEALHARHASLRADRLKLSTSISASLKDSKPGPEYANSLLDKHLALNAMNSSLDICFAKLKSLDCKKEEAIQALVQQVQESQSRERRHRATSSVATHSTQASISSYSSKASTPDLGYGHLPTLQEREARGAAPSRDIGSVRSAADQTHDRLASGVEGRDFASGAGTDADRQRESLADGLPTPRPIVPTRKASESDESNVSVQDNSSTHTTRTSPEQKRNTMVKMPTISPAPSLFTNEIVDMSPVSPIDDDNDNDSLIKPKRITVKGAKAARILGLMAGRSESPSGITLPDASPTETRSSPDKHFAAEQKIQRKPLPGAPKTVAPAPPARQAPMPPQPGRKRTNDSASTVQTDSSPESEVRTPRESQEGLVPKGLKIFGKKQRAQEPVEVQVVNDDDILDYYAAR